MSTDWFWTSSSSTSYATPAGAGSSAIATSPTQTISQQTYTPGATGASAIATASPGGSTVNVSVNPSADIPSPPILFPNPSPQPSPDVSTDSSLAITPAIFSLRFQRDGKIIQGKKFGDFLKGSGRCDQMHGDRGNDVLTGKSGNDWIVGGRGHDRLSGGQGDDWLEGGDGRDILSGQAGQDMLTGGKQGDRFICTGVADPRLADVITDFNAAQGDVIQIKGSPRNFTFEVFDSDGNGMADATLVRATDRVYAIVLSSVHAGVSTLSQSHIIF
jgi:hypothetical protein